MCFIKNLLCLMLVIQFTPIAVAANNYLNSVQSIIDSGEAPEGVVFEIVSGNKHYLDWALPEAKRLSEQLRDKFHGLEIVVVTHGSEQFALTAERLAVNAPLNATLESLSENDIQVHVCGTHAERKGVEAEEFSKLVDVAAEAPAQINDYIKLGYLRIKIVKPGNTEK
jgi:intracellular sulfur oxidation DsrE/DsrF family protein